MKNWVWMGTSFWRMCKSRIEFLLKTSLPFSITSAFFVGCLRFASVGLDAHDHVTAYSPAVKTQTRASLRGTKQSLVNLMI